MEFKVSNVMLETALEYRGAFSLLTQNGNGNVRDVTHCQTNLLDQSLQPDQFLLIRVNFPKVDGSTLGLSGAVKMMLTHLKLVWAVNLIYISMSIHLLRLVNAFSSLSSLIVKFRMSTVHKLEGPPLSWKDVALVTSLRDRMNLVNYEYVACQDAKRGVLILSEKKDLTPRA
ncbi:alpha,alpha-trehalose-phosphate synthase 1-like [Pyrus ussuriensis x Pyrus communis]|uniref:Alpha,alpha-trehalose-phosphate synthase 1-like n=1 Tax=Pyrus ussuriensis x Pyrus communis TaxID=2448454 RepID=A0A5N5HBJ8_9ROSA|nr:alpha,alpha-trehalose-phosphate synthase 1-like [Pyrus ussuriensis x Pyrus communis]